MGNYGAIPKHPLLPFNPRKDEFESSFVQRLKETPFTNSEVYSLDPPIFADPIDIRMSELLRPRIPTRQFFPPTEILKIIANVVGGLRDLAERGYPGHGDLSLDTIYYDKRGKSFRVTHPLFSGESGYKQMKTAKRFSSLSPEQLLSLTDSNDSSGDYVS
jgi:hypothetical protein